MTPRTFILCTDPPGTYPGRPFIGKRRRVTNNKIHRYVTGSLPALLGARKELSPSPIEPSRLQPSQRSLEISPSYLVYSPEAAGDVRLFDVPTLSQARLR